jgi:hypothetical protein
MKNKDDRHDKKETRRWGWRLRETTIMGIRANNNYLGKHDFHKKGKFEKTRNFLSKIRCEKPAASLCLLNR